jgi:hypothetical protein
MFTDRLAALLYELTLFRAAMRQNLVTIPPEHRHLIRIKLCELLIDLEAEAAHSQAESCYQEETIQ